jgi:malate dehydrogenase (oxaloacetate-decarboxylating)
MQIEKGIDKIVKTIRLLILDQPGYLGRVATAVGNAGGNITDLHLVSYGVEYNTRDLTIFFPGLFRGALNARAREICNRMKIAAARTIASFAATGELVPSMLNLDMHKAVAQAVERAAFEAGMARACNPDLPEG